MNNNLSADINQSGGTSVTADVPPDWLCVLIIQTYSTFTFSIVHSCFLLSLL